MVPRALGMFRISAQVEGKFGQALHERIISASNSQRGAAPHPDPASETAAGVSSPGHPRAARKPRPGQGQAATRSPPASLDPTENPGQEQACPTEETPHHTDA